MTSFRYKNTYLKITSKDKVPVFNTNQADSFVQDITKSVNRSGERVATAVSDQTRQLVASNEALQSTMEYGLNQVAD